MITLKPIAWGQPDAALAVAVCRHLVEATPPIIIPANPLTAARLRAWLTSNHIEQERACSPPISVISRPNRSAGKPPATRRKKAAKPAPPRHGTEGRIVRVVAPISRG